MIPDEILASLSPTDISTSWKLIEPFISNQEPPPFIVKDPFHQDKSPDCIRVVCVSDTHNQHNSIPGGIPNGDLFIHAGDFSMCGEEFEMKSFYHFLSQLPHKHKIVIAGNHDTVMDPSYYRRTLDRFQPKTVLNPEIEIDTLREHCTYLCHSKHIIEDFSCFGSPYTHVYDDWAFQRERGADLAAEWDKIPRNLDILVTHEAPFGIGDLEMGIGHIGDVSLLQTVLGRVRPRVHIYGHFHTGRGIFFDGHTLFINAANVGADYIPFGSPIVFDLPRPVPHEAGGTD